MREIEIFGGQMSPTSAMALVFGAIVAGFGVAAILIWLLPPIAS